MGKKPARRKGLIDRPQHSRIFICMFLLGVLGFLPVILQLFNLMVLQYDHYASLALRNQSRTTMVTADRGNIYDCNGNLLAFSVSAPNLYLNPRELRQSRADLPTLSRDLGDILGEDPEKILKKGKNQSRRYEQIGKFLDPETARRVSTYIEEKNLRGVHLEPGARRKYPLGPLAAQVIGFTDSSGQGVEGVELAWNRVLSGKENQVITTKGNNEMDLPFSYENFLNASGGGDLVLTLDTTVQAILERRLQEAIEAYGVKNGAFGLVMNCKTGAILAMTTLGSYDPNDYQKILDPVTREALEAEKQGLAALPEDSEGFREAKSRYEQHLRAAQLKQWRNRVISDGYEPGSTFKVMTMAAALDCGAIDLNTDFYCRGAEQIPGRAQRLHCWRHQGHGAEKTPQALQNSCNIAFAHIALKLGGQRFYDYIGKFGIREKTGIDLKGEGRGIFFDRALIENTEKWGTASLTSGSFGQTFKLTPIQLVRAIGSVVNGGKLLKPYLVSQVLSKDGKVLYERQPEMIRRTISEETSQTMRTLLRSVVTEGTAKNAAVAGYSVGGKTGTSEKIDVFDENGQRVLDKIVSFVGVAPMEDPEYIVLSALDTPSRDCGTYLSGGAMAAPTVGAILRELLPYLEVSKEAMEETVLLENYEGLPLERARALAKGQGLNLSIQGEGDFVKGQIPFAGEKMPEGGEILLYLEAHPDRVSVPELLGLTRKEAESALKNRGLLLLAQGNRDSESKVRSQDPAPGSLLPWGGEVVLEFTDSTIED